MPTEVSLSNVKSLAKNLKSALDDYDVDLKHSQLLHILAKTLGYKNWNTLLAILENKAQALVNEDPIASVDDLEAAMTQPPLEQSEVKIDVESNEQLKSSLEKKPDSIFRNTIQKAKKFLWSNDDVNEKVLQSFIFSMMTDKAEPPESYKKANPFFFRSNADGD